MASIRDEASSEMKRARLRPWGLLIWRHATETLTYPTLPYLDVIHDDAVAAALTRLTQGGHRITGSWRPLWVYYPM